VPFEAIGDQIDRLSDFEFVMCHATSRSSRRRRCRRPVSYIRMRVVLLRSGRLLCK
jgi:hypothetical protein